MHIKRDDNRPHPRGCETGFTLIEVLVVLVITVIGLMALMAMHNATLKGNRDSSRAAEATTIAQRTLEELRARSISDGAESITSRYGTLPLQDVPLDTIFGRAGIMYTRSFSAEHLAAASNALIRLRVVVSWSDSGDDPAVVDELERHQISLELLRTKQEAL